jgi:hypothetical protein
VAAREPFERGVALLHAFAYGDARTAFEAAADADPDCGLAYWGQAMAWWPLLESPPAPAAQQHGHEAARRAVAVGAPTVRERELIGAVRALYLGAGSAGDRLLRFGAAMEQASRAHPTDPDIVSLYALSLLANERTRPGAAPLLERVSRDAPEHPGVAHYLVHAYDSQALADRGVAAARKYAAIAPAFPHARHMPSHIFARLGMWEEVASANRSAWDAFEERAALAGPEETVPADFHSLEWLLYAELQQGRLEGARAALAIAAHRADAGTDADARYHYAEMGARFAIERSQWDEAMQASDGDSSPDAELTMWYARGLGAARAAWPGGKPEFVQQAHDAAARLAALASREGARGPAEQARVAVLAAIAAAQEEREELAILLEHASELEDAQPPADRPPRPVLPVHELAGDLWLQVHRYTDARREYEAALVRHPRRARALAGLARAAAREGEAAVAKDAYDRLQDVWKQADDDVRRALRELGSKDLKIEDEP